MIFIFCRMREHILNLNNPPIVIFPEGTGTNNTAILQFRKGSFEVGSVIHPIAIKVSISSFILFFKTVFI